MNIALISYEFPPDTGFGGIGTYTFHLSNALAERGNYIEIFSCSHKEEKLNISLHPSILLHRVKASDRSVFRNAIVELFRTRNEVISFDLIESPEYCAEGLPLRKAFPSIPMIVKLHTPLFMINELNNVRRKLSFKKKIKKLIGRSSYNKENDKDYQLVNSASAVCSPSYALTHLLKKKWDLKYVEIIPNIFIPGEYYLDIPVTKDDCKVITFTGRLDIRKGIETIIKVIPKVVSQVSDVKFRFIGGDGFTRDGRSMKEHILHKLKKYHSNFEFTGYVKHDQLHHHMNDTGIFIFPSIWENYPYVCLEAMSAGKAIIASKNGGMSEMLQDINGGILIDPLNANEITEALIYLINNPELRVEMGERNRSKMRSYTNDILPAVEEYYNKIVSENHSISSSVG